MNDSSIPRRQIVVCCDGTNNTLTGGADDTNVVQFHNLLASQTPKDAYERILYYDPGVGSPGMLPPTGPIDWLARTWGRLSGLASGSGVYDNIAEAYLFLMRHWRDNGDRIYLFGFSRGAFTARAVAGMVNLFGVVRPEYDALVPTLVHLYFAPSARSKGGWIQRATRWLHAKTSRREMAAAEPGGHAELKADAREGLAEEVRVNFAGPGRSDAWVHWVGVWDTVESVGLPGPFSRVNPTPPTFVGKRYRNVRHALSLDEHRWPFLPRLYQEPGDVDAPVPPAPPFDGPARQTLKQRWYPGVHCDSGGSYPKPEAGISDAALRWMIDEVAADLGIEPIVPDPTKPPVAMWRHDALWEMPYWALAGMTLRNMHPQFADVGKPPVEFRAIPTSNLPEQPIHSLWERRRPFWPVALSMVLGLAFLSASGICLLGSAEVIPTDPMTFVRAVQAAQDFADQQLAALWLEGLFAKGHRPWELVVQPGWAMFWDLGFIACWGYLLARVTSRAFAWLAGDRTVESTRPTWWRLGFAPMVAVVSDVAQNLCTWVAMALYAAGTETAGAVMLWLGGISALLKFVGFAGCLGLLVVRWRIGFNPGLLWPYAQSRHSTKPRAPMHRHHLGDAFAAVALAVLALVLWRFARLTICWGQYDWYGVGSCHSHVGAVVLSALAFVPLVRLGVQLVKPIEVDSQGRRTVANRSASEGLRSIGGLGMTGAAMAIVAVILLVGLLAWLVAGTDILF